MQRVPSDVTRRRFFKLADNAIFDQYRCNMESRVMGHLTAFDAFFSACTYACIIIIL